MDNQHAFVPLTIKFFEKDMAAASRILESIPEAQAAEVLQSLPTSLAVRVVRNLQISFAAALLEHADNTFLERIANQLDPQHYDTLVNLAIVTAALGRRDEAKRWASLGLEANPWRPEAKMMLEKLR